MMVRLCRACRKAWQSNVPEGKCPRCGEECGLVEAIAAINQLLEGEDP